MDDDSQDRASLDAAVIEAYRQRHPDPMADPATLYGRASIALYTVGGIAVAAWTSAQPVYHAFVHTPFYQDLMHRMPFVGPETGAYAVGLAAVAGVHEYLRFRRDRGRHGPEHR